MFSTAARTALKRTALVSSRFSRPSITTIQTQTGIHTHTGTGTRLFGSKPGPASPPAEVYFDNDQTALKLDHARLIKTVSDIRKLLGYETYDVSLLLVEDAEMQETNQRTRRVNAPTDILSFPFSTALEPGVLGDPDFDIPDYYALGDMMLDVPYVIRRCQEDQEDKDGADESDRGVSGAMAKVFDPEQRINMLLVHGMLHLVGHDHEKDDEYELMVTKEEEILKLLGMMPKTDSQ
jgi:ssRNA-specific RNase YbeY (16S rRNA maturation enzyme)